MTELTDFLDTEYGLQRGEHAWQASAVEAGAAVAKDLKGEPEQLRRQLVSDRGLRLLAVKAWLRVARKQEELLPGAAMVRGFRLVGGFATFGGLIIGMGTGRAALSSPSGEPVNLWLCLGMLVLLQVGLLVGTFGFALFAKARGRQWLGALTTLMKWTHRWSWAKRISASDMMQALPRTQKVERWIWLGLTQRFAVFFNIGALLVFVGMLLFSELQFGWATTFASVEPVHMEALVNVLATPWGWAFPESWVPATRVIEATQWNPLEGSFRVPSADGRAWWPFVMMNLLVWGLIPRLLLMQWSANGRAKQLRGLDWNHRRLQDLFDVMLPVPVRVAAGFDSAADGSVSYAANASISKGSDLTMVAWGDWNSSLTLAAGGRDLQSDQDVVAQLAERKVPTVQLVVEAGEAPDKRFTSFVRSLRDALGSGCLIQVCPIQLSAANQWQAPSERDQLIWKRTLAQLRDDHLHVSAVPPQPPTEGAGA
ncbi:MAG: DUF2868 domain-containing protein [Planctomycetes bacterium]|nr:DUF2868 domain-containing protein [Planctomycetota bacterium]MCP4770116.1 DUF2868 domain-containing protein [Planctomycetota bacterium]MCP4860736.1 DUF2868 domain-containing protein [Planctomycetota bacterium]